MTAWWLPTDRSHAATRFSLRDELRVFGRLQVILGLLATVVGFAGVFTVFTYIQPILTRVTQFSASDVSPILLVFGVGMMAGNYLGDRLADRRRDAGGDCRHTGRTVRSYNARVIPRPLHAARLHALATLA